VTFGYRIVLTLLALGFLAGPVPSDAKPRGRKPSADRVDAKKASAPRKPAKKTATKAATKKSVAKKPASCPKGTRTLQTTVKKGESLDAVADRLNVAAADLRRWNRIPDEGPRKGANLRYCQAKLKPGSIGSPNRGSLVGGASIGHSGNGYVLAPSRTRTWATRQTVSDVKSCMARYRKAFRKGPPVNVGDLSARNGGGAAPHVSHESGRDVDVGYVTTPPQSRGFFDRKARPGNLDYPKQWAVLKCFLDNPRTQMIFIEASVADALQQYAAKKKAWRPKYNGILRLDRDHDTHMHVRFKCPKGDKRCID